MNHFSALEFSECCSEEVRSSFDAQCTMGYIETKSGDWTVPDCSIYLKFGNYKF